MTTLQHSPHTIFPSDDNNSYSVFYNLNMQRNNVMLMAEILYCFTKERYLADFVLLMYSNHINESYFKNIVKAM